MSDKKSRPVISSVQSLVVTILIIVFFMGIIFIYYGMLYKETKDGITTEGELKAVRSATEIDRYLSTGLDVIRMTSYTLDNMISAGRSQPEILDYLENQSIASLNIIPENTTGIYAYINGEYLDGSGWVPDADYEPTQRPWYIDAVAAAGRIAVVDPYVDAQTGTMMITLAKALGDGSAVVAMDISMERLQTITENLAAKNSSDGGIQMVLDTDFRVIAHSDRNQIGRNYIEEAGSLGGRIVKALLNTDEGCFTITVGTYEYLVYKADIENEWITLSVTDTTYAYSRLTIPLVLTVVISCLIIIVLLVIRVGFNKSSALAEEMKELADRQTRYAYYDEMTGLKNRRAYSEAIDKLADNMPPDCCVIMADINSLKKANDTRGHAAGDELIEAAAGCLRRAFPCIESIYRIGGDEFCIIMYATESTVNACLDKFAKETSEWHGRYSPSMSVSFGAGFARDHRDLESVLKDADSRMYEFKHNYYVNTGKDRRHS